VAVAASTNIKSCHTCDKQNNQVNLMKWPQFDVPAFNKILAINIAQKIFLVLEK